MSARPSFEELAAIAKGAVEAVALANPGLGIVVIVQEAVKGDDTWPMKFRTVAESNLGGPAGAEICRFMGAQWERSAGF